MSAVTRTLTDNRSVGRALRLGASDELLWNIEKDPCLRSTIVAVSLLDRAPNWDRLMTRMVEACTLVPGLRQRVVVSALPGGHPCWQVDEFFDIDYHMRRVVAPAPADLRAVLDIAGPIAMGTFDRDRPLWEFTLVEGLTGGRAAFIQKVHHSFTDGVGAVQLAASLLDSTRHPPGRSGAANPNGSTAAPMSASALDSVITQLRSAVGVSNRSARVISGLVGRSITDPIGMLGSTARQVRSIARLLAPVRRPLSPIMTGRGMSRRLDSFDFPFASVRAAAHSAGSTVNDAFLAGIAGGMRLYHEYHKSEVSAMRVTMPISQRRPDDPPGGNRFVPARFALPIATMDPRARMREMGELTRAWRREPALPLTGAIAAGLNVLPIQATTSILGSMLKAVDLVATNVPGLQHRAYLAGAEVVRQFAFAPPSGAAFSIALLSHGDRCCIGLNVDTAAVPDPETLTACLRQGFDEVIAVGGR